MIICLLLLSGSLATCGGGNNSLAPASNPTSSAPVLQVSSRNITLSGKQFEEMGPTERVVFTYDRDVVSIVSRTIEGQARTPRGDRVFTATSDSSGDFVDISAIFTDLEGGTYTDVLTLEPQLRAGGVAPKIEVALTLIQEPTVQIVAEIEDSNGTGPKIVEDGPAITIAATLTTGNTIRWESVPFSFTADDGVVALASNPSEGVGSEQVELILSPTTTLVETIKSNGSAFIDIGFQDLDHPGNFAVIDIEVELAD